MKVAIPAFQGRVSPVFDTCQELLIFEEDAEGRLADRMVDFSGVPEFMRAARLRELGVDVLLCGGITHFQARRVQTYGVRLVPWVAGSVQEVMAAYRAGALSDPRYAMPGCCGGRRRGRGGARGPGFRGGRP